MIKKLSYDPKKREETLKERKLDFEHAAEVFSGPLQFTILDARFDYGETRWMTVGYLGRRMVVVVWTERADAKHIISMRKANVKEQKKYKIRMD
jgi:uncharacterized DUF497 family protein